MKQEPAAKKNTYNLMLPDQEMSPDNGVEHCRGLSTILPMKAMSSQWAHHSLAKSFATATAATPSSSRVCVLGDVWRSIGSIHFVVYVRGS